MQNLLFARARAALSAPLERSNLQSWLKTTSIMEKPQFCPKSVLAKVSGQHTEIWAGQTRYQDL